MSLDSNVKANSADDLKNIKIGIRLICPALEAIKKSEIKYKELRQYFEYKTHYDEDLDMKAVVLQDSL